MKELLSKVIIQVNEKIYLKNPESSNLGRNIIKGSIEMIDSVGFESFTFRKLSVEIKSTEASIYRYFESKHKLLLYLTNWYWGWMGYRLAFTIVNVSSAKERLERAILLLTEEPDLIAILDHIDTKKLFSIVISESSKSYLVKEIDSVNEVGAFLEYKDLVERVSEIILEINPKYKYPHMLVSTLIEGSHQQRYFAEHLPRLTDVIEGKKTVSNFYLDLAFKAIAKN